MNGRSDINGRVISNGLSSNQDGLSSNIDGLSNNMDGLSNNIHVLTNEMNGLSSDMTSLSSDMTEDEILDADLILRSFGISDEYSADEYSSLERTEDISTFLNDFSGQKIGIQHVTHSSHVQTGFSFTQPTVIQRVETSGSSNDAGGSRGVNSFPATLQPRESGREEGRGGREEGRGGQSRPLRLPDEDAEMREITRSINPRELRINPRENLCDTAREVFKLLNVHSPSEIQGGVDSGMQGVGGVQGYRGDIPSGPRDSVMNVLQTRVNNDINTPGNGQSFTLSQTVLSTSLTSTHHPSSNHTSLPSSLPSSYPSNLPHLSQDSLSLLSEAQRRSIGQLQGGLEFTGGQEANGGQALSDGLASYQTFLALSQETDQKYRYGGGAPVFTIPSPVPLSPVYLDQKPVLIDSKPAAPPPGASSAGSSPRPSPQSTPPPPQIAGYEAPQRGDNSRSWKRDGRTTPTGKRSRPQTPQGRRSRPQTPTSLSEGENSDGGYRDREPHGSRTGRVTPVENKYQPKLEDMVDEDKYNKRKRDAAASDRGRRDPIKNMLEELQSIIPHIGNPDEEKVSQAGLLMEASDYIRSLMRENNATKENVEALKLKVEELNAEIEASQARLPEHGSPAITRILSSCGKSIPDLFADHVRMKTQDDWRYWVFTSIMGHFVHTFAQEVSNISAKEMERTAVDWIQERMSLQQLRKDAFRKLAKLCSKTSIMENPSVLPEEARGFVALPAGEGGEEEVELNPPAFRY